MTTIEVIRKLKRNGFVFVSQNKHAKYRKGDRTVIVPMHRGDIPIGTLRSLSKQAGFPL